MCVAIPILFFVFLEIQKTVSQPFEGRVVWVAWTSMILALPTTLGWWLTTRRIKARRSAVME
jgi:hypothetical protein